MLCAEEKVASSEHFMAESRAGVMMRRWRTTRGTLD